MNQYLSVCLGCTLVSALSLGLFWNSLENDFVFDDHLAIRNNNDVSSDDWWSLWQNDFWGRNLKQSNSHKSYRPITILTFKLNYLYAEYNAREYHLTNIVFHAAVSVLVFLLTLFLEYMTTSSKHNQGVRNRMVFSAIISSVVFAVHSVHVEAVTGVVGRAESLGAAFSILFVFTAIAANHLLSSFARVLAYSVAAALFFLGAFSKETAATALGIVGFYDLLYITLPVVSMSLQFSGHTPRPRQGTLSPIRQIRSDPSSRTHHKDYWKAASSIWCFFVRSLYLVLLLVGYIAFRIYLMSDTFHFEDVTLSQSQLIRRTENPFHFLEDRTSRLLSKLYVQVRYALLLLYPQDLCCEWSYNCIPAIQTISDPRNLITLTLFMTILYLFFSNFKLAKPSGVIPLALLWIVLTHLPGSGLILIIGTLVAERLLYLPSVGYCILIGNIVSKALYQKKENKKVTDYTEVAAKTSTQSQSRSRLELSRSAQSSRIFSLRTTTAKIVFILLIAYCVWLSQRTVKRNKDWETDGTLFISALDVCPTSSKIQRQVGVLYQNRGEHAEALKYFKRAKKIDPRYCEIDADLGYHFFHLNDLGRAVKYFRKSLQCIYTADKALTNLKVIFEQVYFPLKNATAYGEFGDILMDIGIPEQAVIYYREAGVLNLHASQYSLSEKYLRRALDVIHDRCDVMWWLGQLYEYSGSPEKARLEYLRVMSCNGADAASAKNVAAMSLQNLPR